MKVETAPFAVRVEAAKAYAYSFSWRATGGFFCDYQFRAEAESINSPRPSLRNCSAD